MLFGCEQPFLWVEHCVTSQKTAAKETTSVLIGVGITGNTSVLLIIKRTQSLQTTQNYLLANLAAADVTSLLFCSFSIIPMIKVLPEEAVGNVLCMFFVGFNIPLTAKVVSVLMLAILATEHSNAVVRPLRMLQLTRLLVHGWRPLP